ncbi:calmodulin-A-like [Paramacrobiotus metropolitanus]|uniref:calmodulin-A-like n=1 Tax=Paramacrobiotus metropolitanus TaxID=2943436 RepID=UPI002445C298|nr:calmodulin-A-like [Paramacrobiotus metropolitanus]
MDNRFPASKIKELHEAFRIFDKDGDGSITKDELGTVMRNLGQCPSEEELQQMLRDIDFNGDGMFSFEEFVQIMSNMGAIGGPTSAEDEARELRDAFKVFDKQGTGYITPSDLRAVLQCMGESLTEDEIDDMISEVDLDGDGRIDFEEFVAAMCEQTQEKSEIEDAEDDIDEELMRLEGLNLNIVQ